MMAVCKYIHVVSSVLSVPFLSPSFCEAAQYTLKCLSIGTHKTINFPFVPNGKLVVLGVPVFEHIIIKL